MDIEKQIERYIYHVHCAIIGEEESLKVVRMKSLRIRSIANDRGDELLKEIAQLAFKLGTTEWDKLPNSKYKNCLIKIRSKTDLWKRKHIN